MIKRILRFKENLKKKIPITFIYTQTSQENTIPIVLKFGKNHFDTIYPKIINILCNRYNYNKNDIKIIYLKKEECF